MQQAENTLYTSETNSYKSARVTPLPYVNGRSAIGVDEGLAEAERLSA
ncbi:MAG: hypothetical protein ACXVIZ_07285 [Halobacteriota archaeon]